MSRELGDVLDRIVGGRGVAGLALVAGSAEPADPPCDVVWHPRTLEEEPAFLLYSITKIFTAVLVLQLQEAGRITLDQPLARWRPDVPAAERISLRRLLNHTAGIPDYGGLRAYHDAVRASPDRPWSCDRFAAETFGKGLAFEPGAGWAYSNPGYMLLKHVAEEVTGRRYAELVAERIAGPLGLDRTAVTAEPGDLAALAPAPSSLLAPDGRLVDTRQAYHPGWVSHGVVASTASETARFLHAVSCGRLLSPDSLRQMTTFVAVPPRLVGPPERAARWPHASYGLGLMGDPASRFGALWGHAGGGPGYDTSVFHAPDWCGRAVSVCALCAVEEGAIAEEVVFAVLDDIGEIRSTRRARP